jgi:hypothetical protein
VKAIEIRQLFGFEFALGLLFLLCLSLLLSADVQSFESTLL